MSFKRLTDSIDKENPLVRRCVQWVFEDESPEMTMHHARGAIVSYLAMRKEAEKRGGRLPVIRESSFTTFAVDYLGGPDAFRGRSLETRGEREQAVDETSRAHFKKYDKFAVEEPAYMEAFNALYELNPGFRQMLPAGKMMYSMYVLDGLFKTQRDLDGIQKLMK